MSETVYDILRSFNFEKNNFTQSEWVDFVNELEEGMMMRAYYGGRE